MCTHTHSYADERIQTLLRLDKLTPQPLPKIEMKGFFSEVINMGIIKPPDIESYWKTLWVSEVPFFRMLMP